MNDDDVALVAELAAADPPAALRAETLAAAMADRPAGTSIAAAEPCTPLEAYRRGADDLHALLATLRPEEWDRAAHPEYGPVRSIVAHLVGIEQLALVWVGGGVDPHAGNHVDSTRALVDELAAVDPAVVVARWRASTRELEAACHAVDPATPIVAHDIPTDVDGLLVLRTFELWAHAHDIAVATGRTPPELDPARLALMSTRLMAALPFALALRGTTRTARTARLVLTGPAGGTYDVPLDPGDATGDPDVTIVVSATDICLVAARRLAPAAAPVAVEGDAELADVVLAATDAFARD